MATSVSVNGQFNGMGDLDCFKVSLMAGQRYRFSASLADGAPVSYLHYVIQDASGEPVRSRAGSTAAGPTSMVFTPEHSGDYWVMLRPTLTSDQASAYQLQVSAVAADDHPDSMAAARPLVFGQRVAGNFGRDELSEFDYFSISLTKGQYAVIDLTSVSNFKGYSGVLPFVLTGPDGREIAFTGSTSFRDSAGEHWLYRIQAETSGTYVLRLEHRAGSMKGEYLSSDPVAARYEFQVRTEAADDHADVRSLATPVKLGQSVPIGFSAIGDQDWLLLNLKQGEVVDLGLWKNGLVVTDGPTLSVHDASGNELLSPRDIPTQFRAPETGPYWVLLSSRDQTGFEFRAKLAGQPDPDAQPSSAKSLAFNEMVKGTHEYLGDVDWFAFDVVQGQRYQLNFSMSDQWTSDSMIELRFADKATPVQIYPGRYFDAPVSGKGFLRVIATETTVGASYELGVFPRNRDDHGDTETAASVLQLGNSLSLRLGSTDLDLFQLNLLQGHRYRIELTPKTGGTDTRFELSLSSEASSAVSSILSYAYTELARGAPGGLIYEPVQSGRFFLRASGQGDFTISLREVARDDHGDRPSTATDLGALTSAAFDGRHFSGTESADQLTGSGSPDWLSGGSGNDRLVGLAGSDVLDGGAGLDTAVFSGALANYRVHSWQSVTLVEHRSTREVDRLDSVERLRFDGGGAQLALDLQGHAGQVARVIGALFGKQSLTNQSLVGIGIKALDDGMGYQELISVAVNSQLFATRAGSHSHADFVRTVYTNLFGKAPTSAELQEYTGLLNKGVYTQASLALAACESEINALQIDLVGLADVGLPYLPG